MEDPALAGKDPAFKIEQSGNYLKMDVNFQPSVDRIIGTLI